MCVLGTEIQFIVYNDSECEKAANILYIVLSVTDFIICYEFMKHHTWGTSSRAITRRAQLYTIFLMFKLSCNVTGTWSIRASSEFKPRSTSLSIDSFPCYMSDDRMVTSLVVECAARFRLSRDIWCVWWLYLDFNARCVTSLRIPILSPYACLWLLWILVTFASLIGCQWPADAY